jgi:hypothetical protein
MILFFRVIKLLLKLILIFGIISFEKVIGFPVIFLTIVISLMLISGATSKYVLFIMSAFLLAIFYQLAFILTFLILGCFYLGFVYGYQVIESNLRRFLILLLLSLAIIAAESNLEVTALIVAQLLSGLMISSFFLIKFLFVRYGFLGTTRSKR